MKRFYKKKNNVSLAEIFALLKINNKISSKIIINDIKDLNSAKKKRYYIFQLYKI